MQSIINLEAMNIQWVKDRITSSINRSQQRFTRNDSSNSNSSTNSAPVTTINTPNVTPVRINNSNCNGHYQSTINSCERIHNPLSRSSSPAHGAISPSRTNRMHTLTASLSATIATGKGSTTSFTSNQLHHNQPVQLTYSDRQNSFPGPRTTSNCKKNLNREHVKLSAKSNSSSTIYLNGSTALTNFNNGVYLNQNSLNTNSSLSIASGSLRRRRFKQQYQARLERRLSRQTSSGTSVSTSQEYSSSGTSITANPIVDKLLDFLRDNYAKQMEPLQFQLNKKIRLTSFGKLSYEIHFFFVVDSLTGTFLSLYFSILPV